MVAQQVHSRSVGTIDCHSTLCLPDELSAVGISKSRNKQLVLSGVDIVVRPGEITALIGPSGAGKTTLLKCLSLVEPPDSGRLSIDGIDFDFSSGRKQQIAAPWPKVTVVFQQLFLWPHLTLRENIMLPLGKSIDQTQKAYVLHLLDRFQMATFIDKYPNQASLGQRQRAALVRAMVLNPKYILLDEITSSLDVEQIALILSELKKMRDQGMGILLITHLLHFARDAADTVVFMDKGQVLESGGKELLTQPRHERVKNFLALAELAS